MTQMGIEVIGAPYHRTMLEHDYALLVPARVEQAARADLGGLPVVAPGYETSAHLFPLLIELRALAEAQRVGLLERMQAWQAARGVPYFCALLACDDPPQILQRHLTNRCTVRGPTGKDAWLRYFDPRVFQHLTWVLRPDQLAVLLANIRRWTWPNPDGQWRSLVNGDASAAKRMYPLRIDAGQWPALRRGAAIGAVLAALARSAPELEQNASLGQAADARLDQAEHEFPRATLDDRRLYAEHALRFGDRLFQHPHMQARLASVHAGQQDYLSACGDLDDETLHAWATSTIEPAKDRT